MKKITITLLIYLIVSNATNGQVIKFVVFDKEQNKPCPFVNAIIGDYFTISDDDGNIKIPSSGLMDTDSVIVKSMSYKEFNGDIKSLRGSDTIFLQPKVYMLNEVTIIDNNTSKKRNRILGYNRNFGPYGTQLDPESIIGVYIHPTKHTCKVKDMNFYIENSYGFKQKFRIRIFSFNRGKKEVISDLLEENVFGETIAKEGWMTIDLERFNIVIPKEGALFAIEPLYFNTEELYIKLKDTKLTYILNYPTVKYCHQGNKENSFFYYKPKNKWFESSKGSTETTNHLIYINITEYK